ncbi:Nitroreductase-like protein [Neurospora hispaniola]|uniref:Nitroreductase-like protein n=1 Tax=Neurospora hispaniola TaxID=588809 RepID=A0AAJ0IF28_9PEZI|nr:Nitroreductase-like protein [Neurospora hispaniola]
MRHFAPSRLRATISSGLIRSTTPKPKTLSPFTAISRSTTNITNKPSVTFTSNIHTSSSSKMSSTQISANAVLDLIKQRRTYYPLSKDLGSLTTERINEIVKEALQHVPSSFNSQSNRVVVLLGAEHEKLWDITTETLKAIVPEDSFASTAGKMAMFKGAAGTILFFEDETVVKGMQEQFAVYADRFPVWAVQSDAMLQHTLWVALEAEGLGANLQHYNPLIDAKVAETWSIPESWKLNAQLVFGGKTGDAGEKAFGPVEEKFKSFGSA